MKTDAQKAYQRAYRESEHGKEVTKKSKYIYNHTPTEMEKRRQRTAAYLARPEIAERYKKWRQTPERKENLRRNDLMRKYKITLEQYDAMVVKQKGLCLLCDKYPTKKKLVVDHDHKTGKVRGLLCDPCNVALGFLNDDPKILERAIEYLK